jgi:hypothetical protein
MTLSGFHLGYQMIALVEDRETIVLCRTLRRSESQTHGMYRTYCNCAAVYLT